MQFLLFLDVYYLRVSCQAHTHLESKGCQFITCHYSRMKDSVVLMGNETTCKYISKPYCKEN